MYVYIYIYMYMYTFQIYNAIVRLPYHRSGDSLGQGTFLAPSADKQTHNYDTDIYLSIYLSVCLSVCLSIYLCHI